MREMTKKALNDAFTGESMAHMKYLIFSQMAEKEGYKNVARLFKAIAFAEQVQATNHATNLEMIKETKDNLYSAMEGEIFEVNEIYPSYDAIAKMQEEKGAQLAFYYALEAEKIHAELYQKARQAVENGNDMQINEIYICPICGYTHVGIPPDRCPICGASKEKYEKF
ncbi:MAG: rubrerythrin family protein [Thermoplasmata archaeon]|nr:MAG: rubrerythrin family protein [Thermoplasmata archaeon]